MISVSAITLTLLVSIAAISSAMMAGLLFAFSNFVMQSLNDQPARHAASAMQRINLRIINPVFLSLFMGSALACLAVLVIAAISIYSAGAHPRPVLLAAGSLMYLLGCIGVTLRGNVPLNDQLARLDAVNATDAQCSQAWHDYYHRWQRLNHLRSAAAAAASLLLMLSAAAR